MSQKVLHSTVQYSITHPIRSSLNAPSSDLNWKKSFLSKNRVSRIIEFDFDYLKYNKSESFEKELPMEKVNPFIYPIHIPIQDLPLSAVLMILIAIVIRGQHNGQISAPLCDFKKDEINCEIWYRKWNSEYWVFLLEKEKHQQGTTNSHSQFTNCGVVGWPYCNYSRVALQRTSTGLQKKVRCNDSTLYPDWEFSITWNRDLGKSTL